MTSRFRSMVTLIVVVAVAAFYGGSHMSTGSASSAHKSLQSYPDAVVSVTDSATGDVLTVTADGRSLVAKDRSGKTLWQTDVLASAGEPHTGFPVIRAVEIDDGKAVLIIGKTMVVEVDLKTGKVHVLGEN